MSYDSAIHRSYRRHDVVSCECEIGRDHVADGDAYNAACGSHQYCCGTESCPPHCPGRPLEAERIAAIARARATARGGAA